MWKQPVVVGTKPGAGGMIGMDLVAKAPPDGHTLGIGFNGPIASAPTCTAGMPYAPARDLVPIVLTTSQPNVLAVPAGHPAHTLPEFVAWAKKQPGGSAMRRWARAAPRIWRWSCFAARPVSRPCTCPMRISPPAASRWLATRTRCFTVAPALLPLVHGRTHEA